MSRNVALLLLVVTIFSYTFFAEARECQTNEEYDECGSACPLECNKAPPSYCPLICISGCHCKKGFMRNEAGACVAPEDC